MPEARKVAGIGAITNAEKNDLINKMRNSGAYFIYDLADETFIDSLDAPVIRQKMLYQRNVNTSWKYSLSGVFNYQTINNYILTGYKESSNGQLPQESIEEGIRKFGDDKESNVGEIFIILSIISAIISILISVFTLIKTIVSTFTGDTSNLSAGKANQYDYQGLGGYGGSSGGSSSDEGLKKYTTDDPLGVGISTAGLLGIGAGVVALIVISKRRR